MMWPNGSQAPANRRKPEELRSREQGDAVRPPALTKCLLSSSRSLQRQHHGHHHKKGNIYPLVGPSGYPAVCPYICTVYAHGIDLSPRVFIFVAEMAFYSLMFWPHMWTHSHALKPGQQSPLAK